MLEVKDVKLSNDDDGNLIFITQTIVLAEDQAMSYILLDQLLRDHMNGPLSEKLGDLMSDFGWSFSDDVLSSIDWTTLGDFLQYAQEIVRDFNYAQRTETLCNDIRRELIERTHQDYKIELRGSSIVNGKNGRILICYDQEENSLDLTFTFSPHLTIEIAEYFADRYGKL